MASASAARPTAANATHVTSVMCAQLGWSVVRLPGRLTFMSASAPIDEEHMHQRWILTYPADFPEERGRRFVETYTQGINEDIPLWASKIYRPKPLLRPEDGPIVEFRKWADLFYS